MKNLIRNIMRNPTAILISLATGILLGWMLFHSGGDRQVQKIETTGHEGHDHETAAEVWTCSMHPQIKQDKPGQCPICGMDLIPMTSLKSSSGISNPDEIVMSESAAKIADIQTAIVSRGEPVAEIYLSGMVKADESRMAEITARFPGRVEKLYLNTTGQFVRKGDKLAIIYSPELVNAQRELLEAVSLKEERPALFNAAYGKLKLWGITDMQVQQIIAGKEPIINFDILSPLSGTVTMRHISAGDYIREGMQLFKVVDMSRLWVVFDAYETDLPWIGRGDEIKFSISSLPGDQLTSKVTFVDPVVDSRTRVTGVRVEISNSDYRIKPDMYAKGVLYSAIAGKSDLITIPKSAVLWTGKRSVVYVKEEGRDYPTFSYREIELGPEAGDSYVVVSGLNADEEIVTNGLFKVDAAAQLEGLTSMMSPEEKTAVFVVDSKFRGQLLVFYNQYLIMKDAFVESDASAVSSEASSLLEALGEIDMTLLDGVSHNEWMVLSKKMQSLVMSISSDGDIEKQRENFTGLNNVLYKVVKRFGLGETTAYWEFCPMANDDAGGYWFSNSQEIRNPYFGDMMLTCGEVVEKIKDKR